MERPFVERLPQELWACPAPVDPVLLSAARDDGSNAAVLLDFGGTLVSFTLTSERSYQPRGHSRTGTGKRLDERVIGVRFGELLDLLVVSSDSHHNLFKQSRPCH